MIMLWFLLGVSPRDPSRCTTRRRTCGTRWTLATSEGQSREESRSDRLQLFRVRILHAGPDCSRGVRDVVPVPEELAMDRADRGLEILRFDRERVCDHGRARGDELHVDAFLR